MEIIKIRIIGSCGSGKSFISREISKKFEIPYFELDNVMWDRTVVGKRYPEEVRDARLQEIINKESWIIEGVQYKWSGETFKEADWIYIIKPNPVVRNIRIATRFIKTRMGIESRNYKQTLVNLIKMYKWNRKYDRVDLMKIYKHTEEYANKRLIVKDNKDIIKHVERLL